MIKRVTCLIYVATCLYKGRDDQFCYSINGCRLTEALKASLCRLQQRACPHSSCSLQWKNSLLLPENRKEKKKKSCFPEIKRYMRDTIYWSAWCWPTYQSCVLCAFLSSCCTCKTGECESWYAGMSTSLFNLFYN